MTSQAEKTSEYWIADQKCKALVEENEIRFAGLINCMGKLIVGCFKPGIKPLEDDAELQKMYMELALRVSMRKEFDYSLGPVKYAASRRQKALMISFPINSNVLLISTEPNVDIDLTAKKVMKIMGLN